MDMRQTIADPVLPRRPGGQTLRAAAGKLWGDFRRSLGTAVFLRLFVGYSSFLLAFLLLFFGFIQYTNRVLTEKTLAISQEVLQNGIARLESTLESYQSTASLLYNSASIAKLGSLRGSVRPPYQDAQASREYYTIYEGQTYFSSIVTNLPTKENCGLVLRNGMVLLKKQYYETPEAMYGEFLRCGDFADYDAWHTFLSGGQGGGTLLPEQIYVENGSWAYRALTYALPLPLSAKKPSALFFVTVRADDVRNILLPAERTALGALRLTDGGGNTLLAFGQAVEGNASVSVAGKTGLRATLMLADNAFQAELQPFQRFARLFILGYLLLGILLAVFYAYRSSRPVLFLLHAASLLDHTARAPMPEGRLRVAREYRYIMEVLENSGVALQSYEEALELQAEQTRYYLFAGLLDGSLSAGEMREMCARHFKDFFIAPAEVDNPAGAGSPAGADDPPVYMLLLRPQPEAAGEDRESRTALQLPLIRRFLPGDSICYQIRGDVVALVRGGPPGPDGRDWAGVLGDAVRTLPDPAFQIAVGGGRPIRALREEPRSFSETYARLQHLLRFSLYHGAEDACRGGGYDAQDEGGSGYWQKFPQINHTSVYRMLLNNRCESLEGLMDECLAFVRGARPVAEDTLRYIFHACTNALTELQDSLPPVGEPVAIPIYDQQCDVETLFERLRHTLQAACRRVAACSSFSDEARQREIMAYIDGNISNSELYVKMVTDRFGISEYELTNIIQRRSGLSFFPYVERARMWEARRLVEETQLPVNEICLRCGYNSRITFSRAFRRCHGVSPSKMREQRD